MTDNEEIIHVENISKRFGNPSNPNSVLALDNISFSMTAGANALLGPNGAGKSTLIKILLGYISADSGSAQLMGYDIFKEGKKIRERIGYMPEHFCLIPGLNAVKQVALLGKIAGLPNAEAMQRSHETLEYVGLHEARYREVKGFSTGMLQRLKLAQSLVNDPELIILDEPTNGLDPKGRIEMIKLIHEISHEHAIDLIVSSHLLPDIEATCDYATILNRGKVITQGNIKELTGQETETQSTRVMNVQIKGSFNKFLTELENKGYSFTVDNKVIHIQYKDKLLANKLMEIAAETGVQIRSMTPRKAALEDVFVHEVMEDRNFSNQKIKPVK
ncbi:MAG: ABC transporter ATP-binding protein [Asgard group archaeon]|nr:ABC transporter ATP-binding protein [Asgard group archaeon]